MNPCVTRTSLIMGFMKLMYETIFHIQLLGSMRHPYLGLTTRKRSWIHSSTYLMIVNLSKHACGEGHEDPVDALMRACMRLMAHLALLSAFSLLSVYRTAAEEGRDQSREGLVDSASHLPPNTLVLNECPCCSSSSASSKPPFFAPPLPPRLPVDEAEPLCDRERRRAAAKRQIRIACSLARVAEATPRRAR